MFAAIYFVGFLRKKKKLKNFTHLCKKSLILKSPEFRNQLYAAYDTALSLWLVPYEEMDIVTQLHRFLLSIFNFELKNSVVP